MRVVRSFGSWGWAWLIGVGTTLLMDAVDAYRHEACDIWAQRGECDTNPQFMLTECAAACHSVFQHARVDANLLAHVHSVYDLSAHDLQGNVVDWATLRDHVVLVTNVASQCGYTDEHYTQLGQLQQKWNTGAATQSSSSTSTTTTTTHPPLTILAFPCNQFGAQEPGTADEIQSFVAERFDIANTDSSNSNIRLMEKINVIGPTAHLVYKYLKNVTDTPEIGWNFETYFVISPYTGAVRAIHDHPEPLDLWEDLVHAVQEAHTTTGATCNTHM